MIENINSFYHYAQPITSVSAARSYGGDARFEDTNFIYHRADAVVLRVPRLDGLSSSASAVVGIFSFEYADLLKKINWLSDFYDEGKGLTSSKTMLPYYKNIDDLLVGKQFSLCNKFLTYLQVKQLSDSMLIGVVRITYPARAHLSVWADTLARVRNELASRGLDINKLLAGLS